MLKDIVAKKILIVKPSALGDIVHSLPFLCAARGRFPEAKIDWVVARGLEPLLENHPMINRLWIIDKGNWKKISRLKTTVAELKALAGNLKSEHYDLVIDLQGLMRSAIICKMTGCKCRIGFKEAREGAAILYTHKIPCKWDQMHAVDRYLKVAEALGCEIRKVEHVFTRFDENPPVMSQLPDEYIVMAPSAGKEANRWPASRFGELAAKLPYPTVAVSSKADSAVVGELVAHSGGKAVSLAGKTSIPELAAVIKKARFFVSNDTGPMHIAAALGVPVFAIFGPANPAKTGPYGDIHTIISANAPCSPCYAKKKCADWICMESLTADTVLGAITRKIGTRGPDKS